MAACAGYMALLKPHHNGHVVTWELPATNQCSKETVVPQMPVSPCLQLVSQQGRCCCDAHTATAGTPHRSAALLELNSLLQILVCQETHVHLRSRVRMLCETCMQVKLHTALACTQLASLQPWRVNSKFGPSLFYLSLGTCHKAQ